MNQRGAVDEGDDERNLFRPGEVITMERRPQEVSAPAQRAMQPEQPPLASDGGGDDRTDARTSPEDQAHPAQKQYFAVSEQNFDGESHSFADGAVTWTASEFVAHHKSGPWYTGLGAVAIVIAVVVWLLTRDIFVSATVIVGITLLGIYGSRRPRQESYMLDERGLSIGRRHYSYYEFRSFSIAAEGAFTAIEFAPLKRLATYITVYYDPADEDRIVNLLNRHLPMEPPRNDLTDQLMRRISF